MRLRLVVLFLLTIGTANAEPMGGGGLPHFLMADVFGTALAFMAPRTLDATPVSDLTVWGLHGITAIDPSLTTQLVQSPTLALMPSGIEPSAAVLGQISLMGPEGTILSLPAPESDDAAGWGDTAARLAEAAARYSPAVRQAGASGMIQSFFEELFNHLDPYSRYVGPAGATTDRARRSGSGAVGFTVSDANRLITVADIAPGSPADQAGVQIGDLVLEIDGHATRGQAAEVVDQWLAGDVGSSAEITLRHPQGMPATIDLDRVLVPPNTVSVTRDGDVAVLGVSGFAADTGERMKKAIMALMANMVPPGGGGAAAGAPPQGIVLDLRDNRGGVLRQAIDAADALQTTGLIVATRGRAPDSNHDFIAQADDLSHGLPVVVLVDGRSASAAEILAAALADNRRAVVVGSATLGKGLVQTILPLPDGGELFVTWSRVVAPRGWPLQGLGVLPQVCTSNGEQALDQQLAELADGTQSMADALAQSRAARAPLPSVQLLELRAPCPAAEAGDQDMAAAHWLIEHPIAYETALLPQIPAQSGGGDAVRP